MVDHYAVLGLAFGASPDEIKKAHKKMALKYHPDKNRGDEAKSKKFMEIQEAYQALSDDKVKEAYDAMCQAKVAREAKVQEMDKKRKADVEALEARERAAAKRKSGTAEDGYKTAVHNYESELARMRERNKQFMQDIEEKRQEENERQANSLRSAVEGKVDDAQRQRDAHLELSRTIKVKWAKKGAVSQELLESIFGAYGDIDRAVAGKKSGMVVLQDNGAAAKAFHAVSSGSVSAAAEAGIVVEWLQPAGASDNNKHPSATSATPAPALSTPQDGDAARVGGGGGEPHAASAARENGAAEVPRGDAAGHSYSQGAGAGGRCGGRGEAGGGNETGGASMPSFSSWHPGGSAPDDSILSHRDYESITLMRMRQAAERQKLAAQMAAEEDAAEENGT